ncbi:MAG: DUF4286 family protein [Muribaculaceae bacterium]|nr:DUF4286 family protein [Muribaculaceae bacterium]
MPTQYLINTSFHADKGVVDALRAEVAANFASMATASGIFEDPIMANILVQTEENVVSFTLQFKASDLNKALQWIYQGEGGEYLASLSAKYGQRMAYFTTPMKIF